MKCLLFGLGQAGMAALRLLRERNAEIVGVYSRKSHVGEDIGMLSGGEMAGQCVQAVSTFKPEPGTADIALFFTTSTIDDLMKEPLDCVECGINVLTIAEMALYPWVLDPDACTRLDEAARRNGCSITATGVNDTVMCHLPAIVGGIAPDVKSIVVDCAGNFGALGPGTLNALPLGLTAEEYAAAAADEPEFPSDATTSGQVARALAAAARLTVTGLQVDVAPTFTASAIAVPTIGRTIAAGLTSGICETARVDTAEGIPIRIVLYGKLFEPHDEEYLTVTVAGPVPLKLDLRPLPSIETTAAIAVGRAPDVIAAPAGLISIDRLPTALWRTQSSYR